MRLAELHFEQECESVRQGSTNYIHQEIPSPGRRSNYERHVLRVTTDEFQGGHHASDHGDDYAVDDVR
jgi:hypothetical protein